MFGTRNTIMPYQSNSKNKKVQYAHIIPYIDYCEFTVEYTLNSLLQQNN